MNAFEKMALREFARREGRRWKSALRDHWMRACADLPEYINPYDDPHTGLEYRSALQRLRNAPDFGPRGLARLRLADMVVRT